MPVKSNAKIRNRKVAIATSHVMTSAAGEEIIHSGGNIWDAAIAAHFAMMITEPCMASLGGAGMATVAKAGEKIRTLDFFSQTPSQSIHKLQGVDPIEVNFGNTIETYYIGHGTIAVPGTMAGLWTLHEMGASMPMTELVQPAISYCKSGVKLNAFQRTDLTLLKKIIANDPQGVEIFLDDDEIKGQGSLIKMPYLADALDYLSRNDHKEFYRGELANLFFKDHINVGNCRPQDWESYQSVWRSSREIIRNNKHIYFPDRPSFGGLSLEYFWDQYKSNLDLNPQIWVDAYLSMRDVRIDKEKLMAHFGYDDISLMSRGTSHFSMMDNMGNAISLTSTIGEGAGYFIPNSGIHMNNMLGEEALMPKGIGSWIENQRLDTMTTPVILCDDEFNLEGAIGSAGGSRIPFVIAQCIDKIWAGMSLLEAIDSPRLHDDLKIIQLEKEIDGLIFDNVHSHIWDETSLYFGGVQGVWNINGHLEAHGDSRREGHGMLCP